MLALSNLIGRLAGAQNAPLRLSFDARSMGLFFAIWSLLNLIGSALQLGQQVVQYSPFTRVVLATMTDGLILGSQMVLVVGAMASLVGGWRMYRGRSRGRSLVLAGLLLGIAGTVVIWVAFRVGGLELLDQLPGVGFLLLYCWVVLMSRAWDSADVSGGSEVTAGPLPT